MQKHVAAQEIERQQEIARGLSGRLGGKKYHIVTYGCQMNSHESETLAGMLEEMGLVHTPAKEEANVLLYNTCCVRENAEKRVFGNIGALLKIKQERGDLLIGVCGCMMQQPGMSQRFLKRYKFVDFVLGTQGAHLLPEVIKSAMDGQVDAVCDDERIAEGLPIRLKSSISASITIMYGCNNFCSYCIVPQVRGRERSRDAGAIIAEAEKLAKQGVKEIMLLGQNVNSFDGGMDFANLVRNLDGIIPRIRFMTSHPKDFSESLISAMADCPSVMRQLHLPVQSGSDAILAKMNRRYTTGHYLSMLKMAREAMPNLGVSTDFIVGFPGETEEDFAQTLELTQQAQYDAAFTFAYSPRTGTAAAQMEGQIPEDVKKERLARLIACKDTVAKGVMKGLIGTQDSLLVEGISKRGDGVTGRTGRGITMNIAGEAAAGEIRPVRITAIKRNTVMGEFI